ncbi:DUF2244 domain-containing protein [Roseomonas sp. 18066]|uniref:DUF2244 domain-containing protein n=1 Tax=Roseomonas sp. 18066 TaxID=2681412 RepID=UPI0013572D88|nr:DUF2244 domain-containing protein [Roseomonas sp. 18066]
MPPEPALQPEPILFEAVSTPHRSFRPRGFFLLAGLAIAWAVGGGVVFLALGAWPVVPFLGLEILGVLGLVVLHHRASARAREVVSLTAGRIRVRRVDARGRREDAALDPYWTRVEWHERLGLCLAQRGRRVAIGRFLSEVEQQELAETLREVLRRYREPVFDNPQLRDSF